MPLMTMKAASHSAPDCRSRIASTIRASIANSTGTAMAKTSPPAQCNAGECAKRSFSSQRGLPTKAVSSTASEHVRTCAPRERKKANSASAATGTP
jgi:hypothetical protein